MRSRQSKMKNRVCQTSSIMRCIMRTHPLNGRLCNSKDLVESSTTHFIEARLFESLKSDSFLCQERLHSLKRLLK